MPFEFSNHSTASGMPYLRVDASGKVEFEDAELLIAAFSDLSHHRGKILSVVARGTDYRPRARKHFQTVYDKFSAIAIVVTSPVLRAAINLMVRLMGNKGGTARFFSSEAEALAWLEGQPTLAER